MNFGILKRNNKKLLMILGIVTIISVSTVSIILISININQDTDLQVEFFPKTMKSCPNHTAWLIANLSYLGDATDNAFSLNIETNTTIEYSYNLWNKTVESHLFEIFLTPTSEHLNLDIEVKLTVQFGDLKVSDTAIIRVVNWTLDDSDYAETIIEPFVSYFSQNKPDFQINENTTWEGISSGIEILIVEHFLFKSDLWELEVSWHVMIAPYDWVSVYLRQRSDFTPIWGGKIESWSNGNHTIVEVNQPTEVYR